MLSTGRHLGKAGQRLIIAGGPGSGKSSLLAALAASGEVCYEEIARPFIREQLACGGNLLPWGDVVGFARECGERMRAQIAHSGAHARAFFDRGLPDLMGYLRHGGHAPPEALRAGSRAYTPLVFFTPAWRDIYVNDSERPQTYSHAAELSAHVRDAYVECGFRVVEMVKGTVAERVRQVREHLKLARWSDAPS